MRRAGWLQTVDETGRPHVLRLSEYYRHVRSMNQPSSCICNPRMVDGVVVHRTLSTERLYTPLKGRGN